MQAKQYLGRIGTLSLALFLCACGPEKPPGSSGGDDDDGPADPALDVDDDGDGYTENQGDCNDGVPGISPGATEICNGSDEDCSGRPDDPWDLDMDLHGTCGQDCDDNDPTSYVGAAEQLDGKDNDCDGIPDNHRDDTDDDMDGYTELEGDCEDGYPLINPGAVEVLVKEDGVTPEGVDNDCDGLTDVLPPPCDSGLGGVAAIDYAKAMGLCKNVTSATWVGGYPAGGLTAASMAVVPSFGSTYQPHEGASLASLSSGAGGPAPVSPQVSHDFITPSHAHPDPQPDPGDGCGTADPAMVYDYTELVLEIDVPVNALSFSFDFLFMSEEYPEWTCKVYDDTFLVMMTGSMYNGNISFDSMGRPVTVNIGFLNVCAPGSEPPLKPAGTCTGDAEMTGTGYTVPSNAGGTGWLTTTAPVTAGEHIQLRFIIFDEGDGAYDSSVLIDNFRWLGVPVDGPITVD